MKPNALTWMIHRLRSRRADYPDLTRLVEDFDREVLDGKSTLDPDRQAWDAAVTAVERVGGFNE